MTRATIAGLFGLCLLAAPGIALADEPGGHVLLESRLRYESVDQDGFSRTADALTLRTRLGYETGSFHGWKALVEAENVVAVSERYNSGVNGRTAYPSIPDPEGSEINRAQISWSNPHVEVTVGRQRIILSNARFVGNSGFRQNEQTFDAARLVVRAGPDVTATYVYVDNVRRIFGDDHPQGVFRSDSHLAQVEARTGFGRVSAYAYVLDFRNAPALSSATFGARLTGDRALGGGIALTYDVEYARQSDYAGNPARYTVDYLATALGLRRGASSVSIGVERLDGNGAVAFQMPLATLHAFQGWADVFLTTPGAGVRDLNLRASTILPFPPGARAVRLTAAAHDFASADGDVAYGREIDFLVSAPIVRRVTAEMAAAFFDGRGAFADRTKVWVTLDYRF